MLHECQEKLELCTLEREADVLNLIQNIVDFKIVTVFQEKTHHMKEMRFSTLSKTHIQWILSPHKVP